MFSIILIWVIVSHKKVKKKKKIFFFTFLNWDMILGKRWLFSIGNVTEVLPLGRAENSLSNFHQRVKLRIWECYSLFGKFLLKFGLERVPSLSPS